VHSLQRHHIEITDVVLPHQGDGLRLENLRAIERAIVKQHLQKCHVVSRSAEQRAAAHEEFRPLRHFEFHGLERSVALPAEHGRDARLLR